MGRMLLGVIAGVILVPLVVLGWFWLGEPPVAVADPPLPHEGWVASVPLKARIGRDARRSGEKTPPLQADENTLVAGAQVYGEQCAGCHGFHGKPSSYGAHMLPAAPPLWERHKDGSAVGVSDDPPYESYWKVANGIRLTGMPAYQQVLTAREIWQVTLLVAHADKPLPPAALSLVRGQQTLIAAPVAPEKKH
jgi:mono/diheme cytochrome c family protein